MFQSNYRSSPTMYSQTLYKQTDHTLNPLANNYNPYAALYPRPRLSSTCDTEESSAESSSSCGGSSVGSNPYSDTRPYNIGMGSSIGENAEDEHSTSDTSEERRVEEESVGDREPIQGEVTNQERSAVEKFFSGLKTQVIY